MFSELGLTQIWLLSNGVGAVAFFVLTCFVAFSVKCRHAASGLIVMASLVTTVWFTLLALAPLTHISGPFLDLVESTRTALWMITAAWLIPLSRLATYRFWLRGVAVIAAIVVVGYQILQLSEPTAGPAVGHSIAFTVGAVIMSLFGLMFVEQLYRASDSDARWAVKYFCLALATLFAYDFVMYSGALVSHHIAFSVWNARGAVNGLVAPLIGLAAARNAQWGSRLSVSYNAIFRTSALIVGGLYLLVVAGGSAYIRHFDGNWAEVLALLFTIAATLVLVIFFLSGQVRSHARLLLHKHLLPYRYDYREQWLALTRRLGRDDDDIDVYERAVRAIAQPVDSTAGALWIERDGRLVCVADWNMKAANAISESPDGALATYLTRTDRIVDAACVAGNPDGYKGFELPPWFESIERARFIIPVFVGQQRLIGFLVLSAPRAAFDLDWEEIGLLKAFAQQIGVYLDYQEANRALTQARQFEAFNRLTAFLMHDLKNIAGQQSLVLQNAQKHKRNPDFIDDMIATIDNSVSRMRGVLEQLKKISRSENLTERVVVGDMIDRVVKELSGTRPAPTRRGEFSAAVVDVDPDRLIMGLRHLVRNAQDACGENGHVGIATRVRGNVVEICVCDDGEGMTADFIRDSLFQPFVSTKSSRGMGIGAFQVREFARSAGGDVAVDSGPGKGTRFTVMLPVVSDEIVVPALSQGEL